MLKTPSTGNIHDAFFKQLMSAPATAGLFLRERLPAEIAGLLSADPPELVPGSFVDEELAPHHSDLLYRTRLLDSDLEAFIYVLVEHKSAPDPLVGLQLFRYLSNIWDDWRKQEKERKRGQGKREPQRSVPPIIPMLVYHGPKEWTVATNFLGLFGDVPAALKPHLPNFDYFLIDLSQIANSALSGEARLRFFLKTLKYILRPDLAESIDIVLAEAPDLDVLDVVIVLTYIDRGSTKVTRDQVRDTLFRLVPKRAEEIMGQITQPAFDEGQKQGFIQGEAKGKAEALARLLTRRFGALPATVRQRVFAADVDVLDRWLDAAIDAPTLEAVFAVPSSH